MERLSSWFGVFAGLAFLSVGGGWLSEGLRSVFPESDLLSVILGSVALVLGMGFLSVSGRRLIVRVAGEVAEAERNHHTLIMGLSRVSADQVEELENLSFENVDKFKGKVNNPWQQNLRMIWHHIETGGGRRRKYLKRIYVLPSLETSSFKVGGQHLPDVFKGIVERMLSEIATGQVSRVEVAIAQPVDYKDVNQVLNSVNGLIAKARKEAGPRWWPGSGGARTCVDFTSGTKLFSLAAGVAGLQPGVTVGYVDNDGKSTVWEGRVGLADDPTK
ncbi:hypothetical protein [Caenispirillum bisanense]|uniref:hypothetical protein n=1 Tax=Caenispirillum bisanense TaxID=414052 RepID=UPI0031CE186A